MRLIDADALKTPIEDRIDNIPASEYDNGWNNAIYAVIDEIDNAPTVEYTFEEAFQKTVCEQRLYCPERPQGEWIDCSEDYGYAECPFCEHLTTCGDNIDELHYCWHCGAKLGKGGAE